MLSVLLNSQGVRTSYCWTMKQTCKSKSQVQQGSETMRDREPQWTQDLKSKLALQGKSLTVSMVTVAGKCVCMLVTQQLNAQQSCLLCRKEMISDSVCWPMQPVVLLHFGGTGPRQPLALDLEISFPLCLKSTDVLLQFITYPEVSDTVHPNALLQRIWHIHAFFCSCYHFVSNSPSYSNHVMT